MQTLLGPPSGWIGQAVRVNNKDMIVGAGAADVIAWIPDRAPSYRHG